MSNPGVDNLISYWALDEASGNRADSHGSNTLTDNNTVLSGTGVQSNAADFDDANTEYLSITDATASSSLRGNTGDKTIGFWMKLESTPVTCAAVAKWSAGTTAQREYIIRYRHNVTAMELIWYASGGGSDVRVTAGTISAGSWYFVLAWRDASGGNVYLQVNNGTTSSTGSASANGSTGQFEVGHMGGALADYWDGLIDEAFVYDRVLTADERSWLYNSGAGRTYAELSGGGQSPVPIIMQAHAAAGWR